MSYYHGRPQHQARAKRKLPCAHSDRTASSSCPSPLPLLSPGTVESQGHCASRLSQEWLHVLSLNCRFMRWFVGLCLCVSWQLPEEVR